MFGAWQVCFRGSCLPANGYHNAPELNTSKFIPDLDSHLLAGGCPNTDMPSATSLTSLTSLTNHTNSTSSDEQASDSSWYHVQARKASKMMLSGDLGMWRPDGKLQVLGRVDGMVKVLGSRIDLSEVHAAMCDNEAIVSDAAVVAVEGVGKGGAREGSSKELIAYFVPTASANARAARDGLAGVEDEVELWESIYDDAYVKKDAIGAAHDENHAVGRKAEVYDHEDYDDTLANLSAEDMITNWSAYISSYSGKLWPRSTIEHWVNAAVDRFLDMKPKRMLEIGSGNGMLAFRAALRPEVEEVWMADLSGEACRYVEKVCAHPCFAHIKHKCKVLHRPAHDFSGIPDDYFDVVVMNAMVMYYPSMAYFSDVLRKCAKCLRPGGSVYIGCCRSLEHLQHFHTDVTLFNADDDSASALELRRACLNRRMKEKELLTSPDFFYCHHETLPGCFSKASILLRRGYDCPKVGEPGADPRHADAPVEMTRWRYDVWLLKGSLPAEEGVTVPEHAAGAAGAAGATAPPSSRPKIPATGSTERPKMVQTIPFEGARTFDAAIASLLSGSAVADALLVRNVPNARVLDAVACELVIDQVIAEGERRQTPATVGDVRHAIRSKITTQLAASNGGVGVCPEALLERVERLGEGKLGAQMMFTPSTDADANTAASGTNSAAHLFDVVIYWLRDGDPSVKAHMPLREARFRTGALETMVDYGRMQVAPLLSRLAGIELGGALQHRGAGGHGKHLECYGNKRAWSGVTRALATALRETLPSFAVPQRFVAVDVLPLLPTGKTDKRHLPSTMAALLAGGSDRSSTYRAPSTATEQAMVALFTDYIVGGDVSAKVGVDDDFGELGGNSLSAGRLVAACKRSFGVDLAMGDMFEMRTPAKISAAIDKAVANLSDSAREAAAAAKSAPAAAAVTDARDSGGKVVQYDTFLPVPSVPRGGSGEHLTSAGAAAAEQPTIMLHARVWRPASLPADGTEVTAIVDYAPYPLSFMTTTADDATFHPLAARGLVCVRVQARGTDRSQGVCGDPYDFAGVHVPDFTALIERIAATGLPPGATSAGTPVLGMAGVRSIVLHGFSWAATAALRVLALPDGVRPASIRAACLCMGNDELHESDAFFERRVPLAFNSMWSSAFMAIMARPPTDMASADGATWQQRWVERLEALGNLPAKYIRSTRHPSRDPLWRAQSLSEQDDPAHEGHIDDDALLAGLGKLRVPILAAGGGMLGRYGDTVERLVRSRGVAEARGEALPEVKGVLGPWVHAFPHLSSVGPNIDWVGMVCAFAKRHSGGGGGAGASPPPPPESSLTYFESDGSTPSARSIPMRVPGVYRVVSARELAARASDGSAASTTWSATPTGALVPTPAAAVAAADGGGQALVGVVRDAETCGQMGGEWFSWGVGADMAVEQSEDDRRSLCFDLPLGADGCVISGKPIVTVVLGDAAARRALSAPPSGLDCLVARLCVVDASGASHLVALGAASLTLAEPIADQRPGVRTVDAPPNAKLQISMHFTALRVPPAQTLRLALATSYFPLFLAVGGRGDAQLVSVHLTLPQVGGAAVQLPPPELSSNPPTLQRLRAPLHHRAALASGGLGAHILQDDGTVHTEDGLTVSTRSDTYVEMHGGRRLALSSSIATTLSRGTEFARLEIKTSLHSGTDGATEAIASTTVEATASGAPLWNKTFSAPVNL